MVTVCDDATAAAAAAVPECSDGDAEVILIWLADIQTTKMMLLLHAAADVSELFIASQTDSINLPNAVSTLSERWMNGYDVDPEWNQCVAGDLHDDTLKHCWYT